MKKLLFSILLLIIYSSGYSQSSLPKALADSLWGVWNNEKLDDTIRLEAIKKYSWDGYLFAQPDSAFYYAQLQYDFAEKKGIKKQQANALNTQGAAFFIQGDYAKSIVYHTRSLKIREEIGDQKGVAASLGNIGNIYKDQGDALSNLQQKEELYKKAIEYHNRSMKIKEQINDKQGIAASLSNLGIIYRSQGFLESEISKKEEFYHKALELQTKSMELQNEVGNYRGLANTLNNIGLIFAEQGVYLTNPEQKVEHYQKSIYYHNRSLEIHDEIGNKQGVARALINMGAMYFAQTETAIGNTQKRVLYDKVINTNKRALKIAQESEFAREIESSAELLFKCYKATSQFQLALEMHELYSMTKDSIGSKENQNEVIRQEVKYNFEKKAATDSIANAKEKQIKDIEIAKQQVELKAKRNQQYGLFGGLFLVIIFAGVLFNRLKVTQQQKIIIEQQKEIVEEKQKEIIDSIRYAKRIQEAILTSQSYIERNIKRLKSK